MYYNGYIIINYQWLHHYGYITHDNSSCDIGLFYFASFYLQQADTSRYSR